MTFQLSSFPQAIIKQTTAPTATAGTLWWDTDDLLLYYYTGTNWVQISSSSDAAGYEQMVAQLALEILRLSAEGTLTAPDYDSMFIDYFSDADGQDGTIDTGNTTAVFITDTYYNYSNPARSPAVVVDDTSPAETLKQGIKLTTNQECIITSVEVFSGNDSTKIYLTDDAKTTIASADIVSGVATFTTPQTLTNATTYYILTDKEGAGYTRKADVSSLSYPYAFTEFNITHSTNGSGDFTTTYISIKTINVQVTPAAKVLQTNAQALSFNPAYILVHSKDKTTAGTGSFNFNVSFDGGSTWDSENNDLDTKIPITDGSSKNMIIKINLFGDGLGNTSQLKDYEVILWSS